MLCSSVPFHSWETAAYDLPQQNVTEIPRENRLFCVWGKYRVGAFLLPVLPSSMHIPSIWQREGPHLQVLSHLVPSPDNGFLSKPLYLNFTNPISTPLHTQQGKWRWVSVAGPHIPGDKLNIEGKSPGFPCPDWLCGQTVRAAERTD